MVQELKEVPNTLVAFRASGDVSKEEFDAIILPSVVELLKRIDKLNFLLVLDSPFTEFPLESWLHDTMERLNHIDKWNRSAIVFDRNEVNSMGSSMAPFARGEFKIFSNDEFDNAVSWVGEQGIIEKQEFQDEADNTE